jgi:hypothetical protein
MKTIIVGILVVTAVLFVAFVDFTPKASVVTPEVQKTSDYKRPVREGNCWRQFTATDSILVCH